MNRSEALNSLECLSSECSREGWDGYGADPVRGEAVAQARRFLDFLPEQLPVPDLGAEADGCVTLEWYASPDWVLSVSVSSDGQLVYAAILGARKKSGTCVFADVTPSEVLELIQECCSR